MLHLLHTYCLFGQIIGQWQIELCREALNVTAVSAQSANRIGGLLGLRTSSRNTPTWALKARKYASFAWCMCCAISTIRASRCKARAFPWMRRGMRMFIPCCFQRRCSSTPRRSRFASTRVTSPCRCAVTKNNPGGGVETVAALAAPELYSGVSDLDGSFAWGISKSFAAANIRLAARLRKRAAAGLSVSAM